MGIEELKKEILQRTEEELKKLESEEKEEERAVLSKANAKREDMLANAGKVAQGMVEGERKERLAAAKLKARRIITNAREEFVNSILAGAWNEFRQVRNDKGYPKVLAKLIEEGVKEIGEGAIVYVNADDRKIAKEIKGITLAEKPIICEGGALITSADGRVRVRATLEDIFGSKKEALRGLAFEEAFRKRGK